MTDAEKSSRTPSASARHKDRARRRLRQIELAGTRPTSGTTDPLVRDPDRSVDEVAREVGLGSGRTRRPLRPRVSATGHRVRSPQ